MGGCNFTEEVIAKDAETGFRKLVKESIRRYGEDPYNGTISTFSIGKCVGEYDGNSKLNLEKAYKYIEKYGCWRKWLADYIDCGIAKYVEYEPILGEVLAGKESNGYSLLVVDGVYKRVVRQYEKKTECMEALKEQLVEIKRSGVFNSINSTFMIIGNATQKVYQKIEFKKVRESTRKLKALKKQGNILIKEHQWLFFGIAAC